MRGIALWGWAGCWDSARMAMCDYVYEALGVSEHVIVSLTLDCAPGGGDTRNRQWI